VRGSGAVAAAAVNETEDTVAAVAVVHHRVRTAQGDQGQVQGPDLMTALHRGPGAVPGREVGQVLVNIPVDAVVVRIPLPRLTHVPGLELDLHLEVMIRSKLTSLVSAILFTLRIRIANCTVWIIAFSS